MIETKEVFIKKDLSEDIQDFFKKSLNEFGKELNLLAEKMFKYPNGKRGIYNKESINDIFALIERSYIGILNNAIIKCFPYDATLQEFSVYGKDGNDEEHLGRADYLVVHSYNDKTVNLIFEAKLTYTSSSVDSIVELKKLYDKTHSQGLKYFKAEKDFYGNETYIVTIFFDWIWDEKVLKNFIDETFQDDKITHYYFIFYSNPPQAGLLVYGTIIKVHPK